MRTLITGGAGFIGSHVSDAFLGNGDEVAVIDDLSRGRAGRLRPSATLHTIDIRDANTLTATVQRLRPEVICHLAAQTDVRVSVRHPVIDAATNILGTINVLEAARTVDARVILASTGGAIYGGGVPVPSSEAQEPAPEAPYGAGKYCAEQYLDLYNRLYGTKHAALRLANVYGPRQDPTGEAGVVSIFCDRALSGGPSTVFGDGLQTRDFVYVGDAAQAFIAAARTELPGTWNIGTGRETCVLDLVVLVGEVSGRPLHVTYAPERDGEVRRSALAIDQARLALGWTPSVDLTEGVGKVYRWIAAGSPDR